MFQGIGFVQQSEGDWTILMCQYLTDVKLRGFPYY